MTTVLLLLITGVGLGALYFLVASGLSLIYGLMGVLNFAHGSFFMVGIYTAYTLVERFGAVLGFWPALGLAAAAVGVLGAAVEVLLLLAFVGVPWSAELLGGAWPSLLGWGFCLLALVAMPLTDAAHKVLVRRRRRRRPAP